MSPETPQPTYDLRARVVRGVGWMMASQGATQVLAFGTSIAIARLMSRHDVGLAAEALVFATLTLVIADFGLGAVLVQRQRLAAIDIDTVFWASMGLGAGLTAIGVGLSWPISDLYGQPALQPLFAVLSFVFVFTAPSIVQGNLLTRDLEFRSLETRTIVATTCSSATAVTLAAIGLGPWAIIIQSLVISGVSTALLWRSSPWRPSWSFSWPVLRGMMRFSSHNFGANAVAWAQLNADNFLVGRFLGPPALGAYSIAVSASLTPLNRVAQPVGRVFFPAFSRLNDSRQVGEMWLNALRAIALVVVPLTLGLVVIGHEFVIGVFGAKWAPAATPLQLMAPIGLLQALTALTVGILTALDRTRLLWRCAASIAGISVIAFAAGLPWGIEGVAVAYLAASLIAQPILLVITARVVGLALRDVIAAIGGLLQAGIGMLIVVFLVRRGLLAVGLPVFARLVVLVLCGAATYVPLVLWRAPEGRTQLLEAARRRRAGDGDGEQASPITVDGEPLVPGTFGPEPVGPLEPPA